MPMAVAKQPESERSHLGSVLRRLSKHGRASRRGLYANRRFVIAHLDGVSRRVLRTGLERGYLPFLARLLDSGLLTYREAYSGAPTSTPPFQAALLYGDGGDVPGFLWYDRQRKREVRMDQPSEVLRVETQLASHHGGLLVDGSAYGSIFSGGAAEPVFSTSRLARSLALGGSDEKNWRDHLASALAHGLPLAKVTGKAAAQAGAFVVDAARWSIKVGRLKHEPLFFRNRLLLSSLLTDLITDLALLDVCRGVPSIYICFGSYDEVAHRRGPFSEEALRELLSADASIETLWRGMRGSHERPYDLYVISDHGQEATRPIERVMFGVNLLDWILAANQDGNVDPAVAQSIAGRRTRCNMTSRLPFGQRICGGRLETGGGEEKRPNVVVVDGGDLAHVYFTHSETAVYISEIEARWPAVLRAILACPAVGLAAVRGGTHGFAFVRGKRLDLAAPDALKGVLRYDGRLLRDYIARMLAIPSAGDVVVYGAGVPGGDIAFPWEFGSHGGVGLGDVETFVLHDPRVHLDMAIEGPLDIHRFLMTSYFESPGVAPPEPAVEFEPSGEGERNPGGFSQ